MLFEKMIAKYFIIKFLHFYKKKVVFIQKKKNFKFILHFLIIGVMYNFYSVIYRHILSIYGILYSL